MPPMAAKDALFVVYMSLYLLISSLHYMLCREFTPHQVCFVPASSEARLTASRNCSARRFTFLPSAHNGIQTMLFAIPMQITRSWYIWDRSA